MKKIAVLLLFLFTLVQSGPVIKTVFTDSSITIFIVDEEKNVEKNEEGKEDTSFVVYHFLEISLQRSSALQLSEKINISPFVQKSTPPPNSC